MKPTTDELILIRHQAGNLPQPGQATEEITMYRIIRTTVTSKGSCCTSWLAGPLPGTGSQVEMAAWV